MATKHIFFRDSLVLMGTLLPECIFWKFSPHVMPGTLEEAPASLWWRQGGRCSESDHHWTTFPRLKEEQRRKQMMTTRRNRSAPLFEISTNLLCFSVLLFRSVAAPVRPHSCVGQLFVCGDRCDALKVQQIVKQQRTVQPPLLLLLHVLSGVTQPSARCSAP